MDIELAYLAGFFDGEGTITLRPGRRTPTLTVTQVDRRPLDLFQQRFGGRVSARTFDPNPRHQQAYRWDIHAGAREALAALRPFLVVKAGRADEVLAMTPWRLDPKDRIV